MNQHLTYNNYLTWGFNEINNSMRRLSTDTFFVDYKPITRPIKTFRHECIETALLCYEYSKNNGRPLGILYSGGLDSEVMLASFIAANVPFEIFHLSCNKGLLDHETFYVKRFCQRFNLTYNTISFDLLEYMNNLGFDLSISIRSTEIKTSHVLFLMKELAHSHVTVIGNGEPWMHKVDNRFIFAEYESMFTWYNFPYQNNIKSIPGFFQYTPEIFLSFFLDPSIEILRDGFWPENNLRNLKYYLYKNAFPEFYFEKRQKYSGHDILPASFYQQKYLELQSKLTSDNAQDRFFNPNLSHMWWELDDIISHLQGTKKVKGTYRQNPIGQEYSGQYHQ